MLCVFESCDGGLEVIAIGVRGAGIFVFSYRLADAGLSEGGGEGDGFDYGAGDGVVG